MSGFLRRTLLAIPMFLLLLSLAAQAQQQEQDKDQSSQSQTQDQPKRRGGAMQRQRQHMAMLAQKLNLTDAQKQQFQQISREMWKQGAAIRQDSSLTDE